MIIVLFLVHILPEPVAWLIALLASVLASVEALERMTRP